MVLRKWMLFAGLLFLAGKINAQMPVLGADSLKKHYTQKMDRYIDRDSTLGDYYSIDLFGVSVFSDAKQKKANKPEYRITWQELPVYKNIMKRASKNEAMRIMREKGTNSFSKIVLDTYSDNKPVWEIVDSSSVAPKDTFDPAKPLKGYRFAIDPGHFAWDSLTSRLEDKYIDFYVHTTEKDSQRVRFYESQMTYNSAFVLMMKLRDAGAEVMLTRKAYGLTIFGKTFEQWKKDDYPRVLDSLLLLNPKDVNLLSLKNGKLKDNKSIYKFVFRDVELRKRAELINAFHPDLTIIIHYNADEANKDWKKPTDKNFNMAFVGGAFQTGELNDAERRFDFLRLLLTGDLEQSIAVSGIAAQQFVEILKVPLATMNDASYLKQNSIATEMPGVYCRNLSLTRMVMSPVIYGETLYQDNKDESQKLAADAKRLAFGRGGNGVRTSEVGEAYYKAILAWAKPK
jgi:N-acetylmuramoyl-L-alanine amidase